jgi:hypothetical protein
MKSYKFNYTFTTFVFESRLDFSSSHPRALLRTKVTQSFPENPKICRPTDQAPAECLQRSNHTTPTSPATPSRHITAVISCAHPLPTAPSTLDPPRIPSAAYANIMAWLKAAPNTPLEISSAPGTWSCSSTASPVAPLPCSLSMFQVPIEGML